MEAAHSGYTETKGEIERTDAWMKERIAFLQNEFPSMADPEQRLAEVAALCREAEAKSMMLDSLDGKVAAIGGDLEPSEQEQLTSCLKMISANQKVCLSFPWYSCHVSYVWRSLGDALCFV